LTANRKVHTYVWDVELDFVRKVYPFMGASHALELLPLFGRPYSNPTMYTDGERGVAGNMMNVWARFASGTEEYPFYQEIPPGNAFVIEEGPDMRTEVIPMERCEFLGCVPDLFRYAKEGDMKDQKCIKFATAVAPRNALPILFPALAMALAYFLSGGRA